MSHRRSLLFKKSSQSIGLIFAIDTSLATGDGFIIPTDASETYNYNIDWGDGNTSASQTGNASHTYSIGGIYQITITGTFPKFFFNNGGDRLKITSIDQWGDVGYSLNQNNAFYGCANLDSLADDVGWINSVTIGAGMFRSCDLTTLPSLMTLDSLELSASMFRDCDLTSLPSAMTLANLLQSQNMFQNNPLTTLPSVMTLASLSIGNAMFNGCNLTSLPSAMTLGSLTTGGSMFNNNSLTALPSGMTLGLLTGGFRMFYNNSLTSLPSGMTLASLTNGVEIFFGNTISTTDYSQLINNIDSNNANTGVTFHGGNSTYNSSAQTAHDNLTLTKTWTISDGGLV